MPSGAASAVMIERAKPTSSRRAEELLVDVRAAGTVVAEDVVVRQRVAEEVRAVDAALDGLRLVGGAHHRQHARHLRVDREAARHAALAVDDRVVLVDPRLRLLGLDEREAQCADALLGRQADRLAPRARDPQRRVGLLDRLGDDVARRHLQEAPVGPANGSSTIIRATIGSISSHWARLVSRSTPKPSSSAPLDVSPVPSSTRPPETRSSIAALSATRAGCW